MFNFAFAWIFIILPLPFVVWRYLAKNENQLNQALKVPHLQPFVEKVYAKNNNFKSRSKLSLLLLVVVWLLLILAAAQPQWIGDPIKLPISGRDLLIAVDLSGSMQEQDMKVNDQVVNRLAAVKVVLSEFIQKRKGDRLGLILFADHAYLQTPLTYDSQTIETMLLEAEIGLAGKKTAIGEAIGLAIKRVKDLPAEQTKSRVLILLTDGANTAGISPVEIARLAKQIDLKTYTIGIGADEMIVRTIFGRQRVNPSQDLDEKTLKEIAKISGGQYFRARDSENLRQIYQQINQIEPIEVDNKTFRPIKNLYYWPLAFALILSLAVLLFRHFILSKQS